MRFRHLLRAAFAALSLTASPAIAHPADENMWIQVMSVRPSKAVFGAQRIGVYISNNGGAAMTLRELRSDGFEIIIERKKEIFGVEAWQRVDFLRLEPGKAQLLDEPAYRIIAKSVGDPKSPFTPTTPLIADFGPNGAVDVTRPTFPDARPPDEEPGAMQKHPGPPREL